LFLEPLIKKSRNGAAPEDPELQGWLSDNPHYSSPGENPTLWPIQDNHCIPPCFPAYRRGLSRTRLPQRWRSGRNVQRTFADAHGKPYLCGPAFIRYALMVFPCRNLLKTSPG
jgi:hypothetical protein